MVMRLNEDQHLSIDDCHPFRRWRMQYGPYSRSKYSKTQHNMR